MPRRYRRHCRLQTEHRKLHLHRLCGIPPHRLQFGRHCWGTIITMYTGRQHHRAQDAGGIAGQIGARHESGAVPGLHRNTEQGVSNSSGRFGLAEAGQRGRISAARRSCVQAIAAIRAAHGGMEERGCRSRGWAANGCPVSWEAPSTAWQALPASCAMPSARVWTPGGDIHSISNQIAPSPGPSPWQRKKPQEADHYRYFAPL